MKYLPLFFLFPLFLSAQEMSINWGDEYPLEKGLWGKHNFLLDTVSSEFYLLVGTESTGQRVLTFNYQNKLLKERPIAIAYEEESMTISKVVRTSEKVFGIAFLPKKKEKKLEVIAYEFKNGAFLSPKKIFEHYYEMKSFPGNDEWHPVLSPYSDVRESFILSPDRSAVAFVNQVFHDRNYRKEEDFVVAVFDASLELSWSKEINVPSKDYEHIAQHFIIDNEGDNVFFISREEINVKTNRSDYYICQLTDSKGLSKFALNVEPSNRYIISVGLHYNSEKKNISFAGLYLELDESIPIFRPTKHKGVFGGQFDVLRKKFSKIHYSVVTTGQTGQLEVIFTHARLFQTEQGYFYFYTDFKFPSTRTQTILAARFHNLFLASLTPEMEMEEHKIIKRDFSATMGHPGERLLKKGKYHYLMVDSKTLNRDLSDDILRQYKNNRVLQFHRLHPKGTIEEKMRTFHSEKNLQIVKEMICFQKNGQLFIGGQLMKGKDFGSHTTSDEVIRFGTFTPWPDF